MGSRSDNSSGLPGDGGSAEGLPDLPEEWGVIVVPDDLSALTDEVDAVRDELRRAGRRSRWQRVTDRPGLRFLPRLAAAGLRAPVLIGGGATLVGLPVALAIPVVLAAVIVLAARAVTVKPVAEPVTAAR